LTEGAAERTLEHMIPSKGQDSAEVPQDSIVMKVRTNPPLLQDLVRSTAERILVDMVMLDIAVGAHHMLGRAGEVDKLLMVRSHLRQDLEIFLKDLQEAASGSRWYRMLFSTQDHHTFVSRKGLLVLMEVFLFSCVQHRCKNPAMCQSESHSAYPPFRHNTYFLVTLYTSPAWSTVVTSEMLLLAIHTC
jgi:hypothetical protein